MASTARTRGTEVVHVGPDHLLPPAFHASGFHDQGMRQRLRKTVGKIKQGKSDTDQQRFAAPSFQASQGFGQLPELIQVKTTLRMSGSFHQPVNHVYQRRILSFQVGRQQSQYAPVGNRAISPFESPEKTLLINSGIFHIVTAGPVAGCAAAFKHQGRFKQTRFHGPGLEKPNG